MMIIDGSTTFMDEIKTFITNFTENSPSTLIDGLFQFLQEECYDTESLKMDLETTGISVEGNINENVFGQEIPGLIINFIQTQKGSFFTLLFC